MIAHLSRSYILQSLWRIFTLARHPISSRPSYSRTIDTLEELATSEEFAWGIVNYGAADYQLFATSEVP